MPPTYDYRHHLLLLATPPVRATHVQIEHHLFPAISFMHYPKISEIVSDECAKRGIQYAHYATLPEILGRFMRYMREVGEAEQVPARGVAAAQLARL